MLPKITAPAGVEVMLSGKILSPAMTISAGGVAACARAAAPMRPATARQRTCEALELIGEAPFAGVASMFVGNAINGVVAVLSQQQRAVGRDHVTDRPAPGIAIVGDESDQEVLVFAGGHAVLHAHAHDFVPRAEGAVPGAVQDCKAIT